MVDVADVVPPAIDQSGNYVVWFTTATIADTSAPGKVAVMDAATTFRITHSFTPSGFALDGDQEVIVDDRLTLPEGLESLGKVTRSLGLIEYVDSTTAGSAAVVLKPSPPATSISGYFIERRNVSNGVLATAAQKVRVIPVTLGPQITVPVDGTGKFRLKQRVSITGKIVEATLAA